MIIQWRRGGYGQQPGPDLAQEEEGRSGRRRGGGGLRSSLGGVILYLFDTFLPNTPFHIVATLDASEWRCRGAIFFPNHIEWWGTDSIHYVRRF